MKPIAVFYFAVALMLALLFYGIRTLRIKYGKNEECLANQTLRERPPPSYDSLPAEKSTKRKHGKQLSSSNHNVSAHQSTYVTCYHFFGQQGAGVRSLASLLCFLKSLKLPFLLAEPRMEDSTFIGKFTPGENGLKFRDLFNIDTFTERSQEMGNPDMISTKEYINNHMKYKIIIKVVINSQNAVLWKAHSVGGKVDCLHNDNFDIGLSKGLSKCIVRVVQMNVTKTPEKITPFNSTNSLKDFIFGSWSPSDVALEFTKWSGPYHMPIDEDHSCYHRYNSSESMEYLFKPSHRLLADVRQYEDMFLGGKNCRLAIMVRAEKVMKFYQKEGPPNGPKSLEECFDKVITLSRVMESVKPLVTLDIGRFGSNSLNGRSIYYDHVVNTTIRTVETLYHNEWTFEEWENSFVKATGGITNEGYIAALQRNLASRADCLVLVGGGNFQVLAVESYVNYHKASERCIYSVCGTPKMTPLMQSLVEKYKIIIYA